MVQPLADARKAGMTEEELDASVDGIAAVDAGGPASVAGLRPGDVLSAVRE